MILSVSTLSSVDPHQNHATVFIENIWIKRQISTLNLNMSKFKWDRVEEHTIDNFYKSDKCNRSFWIWSLKCGNRPQYHTSNRSWLYYILLVDIWIRLLITVFRYWMLIVSYSIILFINHTWFELLINV